MVPLLPAAMHQIDPAIATTDAATMSDLVRDSQAAYLHRLSASLIGGFAGLALLLSVVGIYGVIAYSVTQRAREIGVRIALGAQRATVYQLVMKEAGWLIATGLVVGLAGALAGSLLIRSLLFSTQPWDAITPTAVAATLATCALIASFLPAHRAASINPIEALHAE